MYRKRQKIIWVPTLCLILASCGVSLPKSTPQEQKQKAANTQRNFVAAKPHIKQSHLDACENKLKGGLRIGTAKLAEKLRPNKKLTCYYVNSSTDTLGGMISTPSEGASYIVYSGLVQFSAIVTMGKERISPKRFLWCRFKVQNGKVTLDKWGEQMQAPRYWKDRNTMQDCGLTAIR